MSGQSRRVNFRLGRAHSIVYKRDNSAQSLALCAVVSSQAAKAAGQFSN